MLDEPDNSPGGPSSNSLLRALGRWNLRHFASTGVKISMQQEHVSVIPERTVASELAVLYETRLVPEIRAE